MSCNHLELKSSLLNSLELKSPGLKFGDEKSGVEVRILLKIRGRNLELKSPELKVLQPFGKQNKPWHQ